MYPAGGVSAGGPIVGPYNLSSGGASGGMKVNGTASSGGLWAKIMSGNIPGQYWQHQMHGYIVTRYGVSEIACVVHADAGPAAQPSVTGQIRPASDYGNLAIRAAVVVVKSVNPIVYELWVQAPGGYAFLSWYPDVIDGEGSYPVIENPNVYLWQALPAGTQYALNLVSPVRFQRGSTLRGTSRPRTARRRVSSPSRCAFQNTPFVWAYANASAGNAAYVTIQSVSTTSFDLGLKAATRWNYGVDWMAISPAGMNCVGEPMTAPDIAFIVALLLAAIDEVTATGPVDDALGDHLHLHRAALASGAVGLNVHEAALWALIAICLVLIGAILTPGTVAVDQRAAILAAIAAVLFAGGLARSIAKGATMARSYPYGKVPSSIGTIVSERFERPMVDCGYCSAQMAARTARAAVGSNGKTEGHKMRANAGRPHWNGSNSTEIRRGLMNVLKVDVDGIEKSAVLGRVKAGYAVVISITYTSLPGYLKTQLGDFGHSVTLRGHRVEGGRDYVGWFDPLYEQGSQATWARWTDVDQALWSTGHNTTKVKWVPPPPPVQPPPTTSAEEDIVTTPTVPKQVNVPKGANMYTYSDFRADPATSSTSTRRARCRWPGTRRPVTTPSASCLPAARHRPR